MATYTYTVPARFDGQTMQNFLRQQCGLSWRMVVKLKRVENGITVDGKPYRTIDRVKEGDVVTVIMPTDQPRIEGMDVDFGVCFEDDHLLIVDKPPFLAVHPSAGKTDPTLANGVVGYFEKKGEPLSFRPISRLDRNTSGLLPVAKSSHLAFALTGQIQKTYLAIVCGRLEGEGYINEPIRIKEGCCITREVGEGGKESRTRFRSIAASDRFSLLEIQLETGRTHQIRVHLSWLGHPLAGDTMYGEDETLSRHALHCTRLQFTHPVTGEQMDLNSPLPKDMKELLQKENLV